jgi:OmpA-OmpF porin, OOP family
MSTRSLFTVLVAAAALASSPAVAQDGWYLGAAIGQSEVKVSCGQPGLIGCDDRDSAWRIFGGYQFNGVVAIELGYADLGEPLSAEVRSGFGFPVHVGAEITAWDLVLLLSAPIRRFSINFPIGLYYARTESTQLSGGYITRTTSKSNAGLTLGLGAGFDLTKNLTLRGQLRRYVKVGGENVGEDDVDLISAGLLWRF